MNKSLLISTFLLLNLVFISSQLLAQCIGTPSLNLYWVGNNGTGNFNDPNNWRVGSNTSTQRPCQSPRSSDNVYFTAASFPTTGAVVTIDMNSNCFNMLWDNIIGTSPSIAGTLEKNLEIYGSLRLPNIGYHNFNYNGSLIFKGAGSNTYELNTKGHNLKLNDFRINLGNTATLLLTSNLVVNNRVNSNSSRNTERTGGIIYHITGHFNSNGFAIDADGFYSNNSNSTRKITFNNSRINLKCGNWYPDLFQISNLATANFSATGSHIIIEDNPSSYLTESLVFSTTLRFDSVTIKTNKARTNWSGKIVANYVYISGKGTTANNANIETTTLQLDAGVILAINNTTAEIAFDNLIMPIGCENFAIIQSTVPNGIIRKRTAGNLVMNNLVLQQVQGSTTGGRTYTANNSFNAGNVSNITVNAPSSCPTDLYFRPTVNNTWHRPENWYDAAGNQVMQIPNPGTNVFFNAASGTGTVNVSTDLGFCNNITFENSINTGLTLNLNYTLAVLGNVLLNNKMSQVSGSSYGFEINSGISLYGKNKTFTSGEVTISAPLNMTGAADYTFLDSLYCNGLNMNLGSMMRASNIGISLTRYTMSGRDFSNVRVHTRGGGWPQISEHSSSSINYADSCIFYINDAGASAAQTISGTFPHTVFNTRGDIGPNINILGDLHIKQSANFAFRTGAEYTNIRVSRNAYFESGIEVVLTAASTSFFRVANNINAIGSCTKPTTIRTHNGAGIEFNIGGIANLQNCFLKGLSSTTNITAINSTDGTGNNNITFTNGVGTTFYWRAKYNNASNFVGNWSDPAHWTTDPNKLTGDSACIPSLADDVVFDIRSYSATSNGCTIDGQAYCKNFTASNTATIRAASIERMWYVAGNFNMANTVNINGYIGSINLVGAGTFDFTTNGRKLFTKELVFDNIAGTWNILSALELDDQQHATYSGKLLLNAGTLNTNANDLILHNGFASETNKARAFNFAGSKITVLMSGNYIAASGTFNRPWSITNPSSITLTAGSLEFLDGSNSTDINFVFGNGLRYGPVKITEANQSVFIHGSAHIQYAEFNSSMRIMNNMSFDSLAVYGGKTYILTAASRQTLVAPHGKLISYGTSSSFINLQTSAIGSKAYIYKDHGNGFCVDFLKVQDVIAQRQSNIALVPSPYNATHTVNLFFDTGDNCDDINGSATSDASSIWRFSLQPLETPRLQLTNTTDVCSYHAFPATFAVPITGTSPYVIAYTWNTGTNSGTGSLTAYDNDNNASTPYYANIPLHSSSANITYTFEVTTYRCGEATTGVGTTTRIQQPVANPLTMVAQTSACYFNNEDNWRTMIGSTNQRPILSLNDYIGTGDIAALTNVNASVAFTGTIQQVNLGGNLYPYLERWWKITPNNNTASKIRFYFTQTELNNLSSQSANFVGNHGGTLDPQTQIQVIKFASGTIGVGPYTIVPHTVIPLAGATASPFTTTAGIIAIELQVSNFSAFIITPNHSALLNGKLHNFDVEKTDKGHAQINWLVEDTREIASFEIEHSLNAQDISTIAILPSNKIEALDSYQFTHIDTKKGHNYYRLKTISETGSINYSAWKVIVIDNILGQIVAYPNPTTGLFNIDLPEIASIDILLYNQLGQVVLNQYSTSISKTHSIDIMHLPAGIYTAQIQLSDNTIKTIQLVKQ